MSLLNFLESENQLQQRPAKQYGASETNKPSVKKKALADVKNILPQKGSQFTHKSYNSATELNIKKKGIFGIPHDKENHQIKDVEKKEINVSPCHCTDEEDHDIYYNADPSSEFTCCDKEEDDYADILLKDLRLSQQTIDKLALVWENPPSVSEKDRIDLDLDLLVVPEPKYLFSNWNPMLESEDFNFEIEAEDVPFVDSDDDSGLESE